MNLKKPIPPLILTGLVGLATPPSERATSWCWYSGSSKGPAHLKLAADVLRRPAAGEPSRTAAVLGVVAAGGIGYELKLAID